MLSASVTLHRKPKDGTDGTSINIKGTCKAHYANYTAAASASYAVGDIIILDSSVDIPSAKVASGTTKAAPSIALCQTTTPTWKVWQPANGDGYVDGDGNMWVAGETAWANAGQIKGDKGDKGEDGTSAVNIIVSGIPMVFDTNDSGIVPSTITKTATITLSQGDVTVTNFTFSFSCVNCSAIVSKTATGLSVKVGNISTVEAVAESKGKEVSVSCQAGSVEVSMVYGGVTYKAQIPWQVNLAVYTGGLRQDTKSLVSSYSKLSGSVDILTDEYSKIEQTYNNISLKVGEASVGRKNLLKGTACKRQGEGWAKMSGGALNDSLPVDQIEVNTGHEGVNCLHCRPYTELVNSEYSYTLAGFRWNGASPQGNIPVTKGKKYTISFWAKTPSTANIEFVVETIWQSSITDISRPAGYTGPGKADSTTDTGPAEVFTANAADTWQMFTRTVEVPSDASYSYIEVCVFARAKTTAAVEGYIARPMLEQADNYNGWTLSPNDTTPVCGNILPNTRLLQKSAVLDTVNGTVTQNAYEGCSMIYTSRLSYSSRAVVLRWVRASLGLEAMEDYTLSFMAKGTGTVLPSFLTGVIYGESSEGEALASSAGGKKELSLTSDWQRYWIHWTPKTMGSYLYLYVTAGSEVYIAQPKLERGAVPTGYTEKTTDGVTEEALLDTGIDIASKKITVTANQFTIQNNAGETTATVDSNGRLTVTDGEFKGTVRAQNFYSGVHILGVTEKTYFCAYSFTSDNSGKSYTAGKYYAADEIGTSSSGISDADEYDSYLIGCTGSADTVLLPHLVTSIRYVRLPRAQDYEGKMVEIIDTSYTNTNETLTAIRVSAADGNSAKFIRGLYASGAPSSSTYLQYAYDSATEHTGKRIRFIALKLENAYYWMQLELVNGHL